MTTYRAACVPAAIGSNGAGINLTTEQQSHLSDADLLAAALPALAEVNSNLRAIDEPEIDQSEIYIDQWID